MMQIRAYMFVFSALTCFVYYKSVPKYFFQDHNTRLGTKRVLKEHFDQNSNTPFLALDIFTGPEDDDVLKTENMYFLETSGRPTLNARQTCAIESAVRNSGLQVYVLMISPRVDMGNEATRNLIVNYKQLKVRQLLPDNIYRGTRMAEISEGIKSDEHNVTFLSDSIRVALLYRFGGWYADLDYVFLEPLNTGWPRGFGNIYAITNITGKHERSPYSYYVSNCIFKGLPGSNMLEDYISVFTDHYLEHSKANQTVQRTKYGPKLLTRSIESQCLGKDWFDLDEYTKANMNDEAVIQTDPMKCANFLLAVQHFIPVGFTRAKLVFWATEHDRPPAYWDRMIGDAKAVHFFSKASSKFNITRNPKRELYSYLGENNCPVSYKILS